MTLEELKTGIIEAMSKIVIDDFSNSPLKGTPFEGMAIIKSLDFSSKRYKLYLQENQNNFNLTDEQIEKIIKHCHSETYNQFIEK
jgi:hypothetical protein